MTRDVQTCVVRTDDGGSRPNGAIYNGKVVSVHTDVQKKRWLGSISCEALMNAMVLLSTVVPSRVRTVSLSTVYCIPLTS
jgi:hypothetical protein